MKFKGHETFYIRKGWLSKGMKNIIKNPILFVDKEHNPMDELGLGSNMVKSLRYWLLATNLCYEELNKSDKKRHQLLTHDFGQIIYENDKFLEEIGTLQLIHYQLCKNKNYATSWYYFFNKFNMSEFTREDFITEMKKYLQEESVELPADSSMGDDFTCIINTYLPHYKTVLTEFDPENNIECPLGELSLVGIANKRKGVTLYKKSILNISNSNPWILMAIICDNCKKQKEIKLNDLLHGENNIGRVFNLDSVTMLELLHNLEKTEMIKIIRTSGLDIIQLNKVYEFSECIKNYYKDLEG